MKHIKLFENLDINPYQELLDKLSKFKIDYNIDTNGENKLLKLSNKESSLINFNIIYNRISGFNMTQYEYKYSYDISKGIYFILLKLEDDYYQINLRIKNNKGQIDSYYYKLDQFIQYKQFFKIIDNYFNKQ